MLTIKNKDDIIKLHRADAGGVHLFFIHRRCVITKVLKIKNKKIKKVVDKRKKTCYHIEVVA